MIYLAGALSSYLHDGDETALGAYGGQALARIWKAERFSWFLTKLMHRFPEDCAFDRRTQIAGLDYVASSSATHTAIADYYLGLPLRRETLEMFQSWRLRSSAARMKEISKALKAAALTCCTMWLVAGTISKRPLVNWATT